MCNYSRLKSTIEVAAVTNMSTVSIRNRIHEFKTKLVLISKIN
ncbi:hypothetical protein BD31_I1713 [Candidatus Nitrosopumilus salaria BD31]|uniref:HTH bat-type domain-containing protein n=1 Tax=Candidatus Nitrosopumilus salarius BD31 TaxID=859350 RepID=I3D1I6_9ARCH|nr:hypothetical protein BD31_I1713 [Candidatus Nitrosopumilus salaria BD31]